MSDRAKPSAPPSPRVGGLETAGDVKREAAKLYRAARRGDVEAGDASKLASVLALVLRCVEGSEIEQRIAALEQQQGGRR